MAGEKKQSDAVKMSEMHDVVGENYSKLSNEFAKSQQQHLKEISDLQKEYLESVNVAVKTTISVQKELLLNINPKHQIPNTATTQVDKVINQSNEYTTDMIRWMNIQNQFIANTIEALKEYVKNYNSTIVMMAEYNSNMIKAWNSAVSKTE